jgi:photosystem II stability/assembly factor-like uncharacterized protein
MKVTIMQSKKNMLLVIVLLSMGIFLQWAAPADKEEIDSAIFGDINARNIGPAVMSGRITDIRCVDSNPDIVYIGTASGGVWKSTDKGITFEPVFDEYTMSIGCITIDPKNPETIWVGTGETNMRNSVSIGTGVYLTTNGGKTWEFMGLKDSERISRVLIHPGEPGTIYAAAAGHLWNANNERGLYKSTDNGKTWERILFVDENTGCIDVDMHPQKNNILLAAMWEFRRKPYFFTSGGKGSGLFRSIDGGKTWKEIRKGLPKGILGRIAVDFAPSKPDLVYAIVEAKDTALYKSNDAGETWEEVGTSFGLKMRPFYFANIVVDPQDPERLYNPSFFLFTSTNGGKSFQTLMNTYYRSTMHPDLHALWINPNDPKHLMVGTDGGVYVSFNRGNTFRHLSNLPLSQFYHVSCDLETPYNVYGGLQDNGSWYGPSRSLQGGYIPNKSWKYVGSGDGFSVYRDPRDKDIVYSNWQGGSLQRYNERTGETADIKPMPSAAEPKYRFNWNAGVALSPTNKETLYIGAQFLFKSTDQGKSWTKISPDLTGNDPEKQQQEKSGGLTIDNTTAENHCTIITISESPLDENVIWVGTDDGNLQLTINGGEKWENTVKNIKGLPPNTWCPTVEAGHYSKGTAYVVFDGHRTGDITPYVYKTEDFGRTWTSLVTPGIEGYCHVIREDLQNPQLLFLGTEFGLYVSFNQGKNWVHFKETLPKVAVMDMCIQPVEHDLVLGTHGRGIYILDDITPLRHISEDLFQQDVVILPARPSDTVLPSFDFKMTGDTEYFGENPQKGAVITYYLKKRHIFGEFKLEILNSKGEVIKTLPTGKRRGINRVYWSTSLRLPKLASTGSLGGMVFAGPTVEPGTYTVRLTKNKKEYTSTIELRPDKLTTHSQEDRQVRHNAVMKTYNMLEHMAYIADTLKGIKEDLEKIVKKEEKKIPRKVKKFIEKQVEIVEGIRGEIIDPDADMYSSEKLQGKTITLYSSMLGYAGRPSESQLTYVNTLETRLAEVEKRFNDFIEKKLTNLNQWLAVLKVAEIKIISEEEYQKELDK